MYYRAEQILSAYPKEFTAIMKGRGSLLCTDSTGVYLLKEYRGSKQRLELLEQVWEYLNEHDFLTESLVRTAEGEVCYNDTDGTCYFLRKTVRARECDTRSQEEILHVIRHMAKMHKLLAECPVKSEIEPERSSAETMERHTRELKKVKNYVRAKKKKNAFEYEFMRNFDHYMAQASQALTLQRAEAVPESGRQLCHGDFNQHHLLFDKEKLAVVGFDKLHRDICVTDLTNFMRKILEKCNWDGGFGMDMVMAYHGVRELELWEWKQLYQHLLYPEKYWKIVNHYFNARKTWVSFRDIEKLQRMCEQETKREEFLSMLFYLAK